MKILEFIEKLEISKPMLVEMKIYKKNEFIFEIGDVADKFYCIAEGKVKLTSKPKNKEITKAILTKGEIFGEYNFGKDVSEDNAKSIDKKTKVYIINNEDLTKAFSEDPQIMLYFLTIINEKRKKLDDKLVSLVYRSSKCRIVEYLLELHENRGERMGYEYIVRDFITHAEIAQITSTSRQTVTTVLNDIRDRNIIEFDRKRLIIKDLEALSSETDECKIR